MQNTSNLQLRIYFFLGYSFRRSAISQALNSGATSAAIKTHFDIKNLQKVQTVSQDYEYSIPVYQPSQPYQSSQEEKPIEPSPHIKAKVDALNEKKLEFIKTNKEVNRVILQPTSTNCEQKVIKVLPPEISKFHSRLVVIF